jgi:hypothetical protein
VESSAASLVPAQDFSHRDDHPSRLRDLRPELEFFPIPIRTDSPIEERDVRSPNQSEIGTHFPEMRPVTASQETTCGEFKKAGMARAFARGQRPGHDRTRLVHSEARRTARRSTFRRNGDLSRGRSGWDCRSNLRI